MLLVFSLTPFSYQTKIKHVMKVVSKIKEQNRENEKDSQLFIAKTSILKEETKTTHTRIS